MTGDPAGSSTGWQKPLLLTHLSIPMAQRQQQQHWQPCASQGDRQLCLRCSDVVSLPGQTAVSDRLLRMPWKWDGGPIAKEATSLEESLISVSLLGVSRWFKILRYNAQRQQQSKTAAVYIMHSETEMMMRRRWPINFTNSLAGARCDSV